MFPAIRKQSVHSRSVLNERFLTEEIKPEAILGIRSLQVTKQLVFDNWEPLYKYTKAVLIYNPSPRTQRFLYEVPKSSVFSVDLPHPVKLAPSKSVKIIIYFRPRDNKNYSDKLFIRTMENEKIVVKLHAIATIPTLLGPEVVEFDICGVSQTLEKVYYLENNSDKKLTFSWRALEPFKFDPSTAYLAAKKKKTIKITFSPKRACFYTGMARCKNSVNNYVLNVKLTGRAVYPYLTIHLVKTENYSDECRFNFGVVNVNSITTQDITMTNCLPVKTKISVSRSPMYNVTSISPFSFSDFKATVEPLGKLTLKVNYQPLVPSYNDSDVWIVTVHGGFSSKLIHLSGISRGPAVTLNTSCLDFTETEKGSIVEKSIKISNSSKVATTFEFQVDCNESVFKFTPVLGELASESTEIIHVQFCPPYPLTYYRRIPCIIHLHEPVYLDLIGTAISSYSQPERLQQSHLELFWLQTRKGQFFFSDDELIFPYALPKPKPLPVDEYLYDGYHSEFTLISPPLSLDQHEIDFGECCANSTSTKVFSLTNHTLFVMTVTWMGGSDHVFFVKPLVASIQPQRTGVFHLTFNPTYANQVFWSELEGFAHVSGGGTDYLNLGNFSWPPWCLTLRVQGNTFMNTTMYRANYKLSSCRIQLPAVPVKSHAARTVLIINQTPTTKIIYHMKSKTEGLVIKPRHGVFNKNFTTITFGLVPRSLGPYLARVQLETNFDKKIQQDLIIEGVASQPILVLGYSTGIYFKPTCVGMTTQRLQMTHNISPISVHFIWNFKSNYGKLLSVEPNEGIIVPNGVQYFKWSFCPSKKKVYFFAATLVADSAGTFGVRTYTRQEITILGEGSSVCIVADPTQLNLTTLTVGMLSIGSLKIYNYSFCDLNIELTIAKDETRCHSLYKGYIDNSHPCVLFDVSGNPKSKQFIYLPARCSQIIYLRLLPLHLGKQKFSINYTLLTTIDNCSYLISPKRLSGITVAGSYPALKILETRFLGIASKIRRDRAWQLLSLDKVNKYFEKEPLFDKNSLEINESFFPLLDTMHPTPKTIQKFYFNLPPATENSAPCIAVLLLTNPGVVDTTWTMWYPWEQKVGAEIWSQSGQFLENDAQISRIKDNNLIQIEPRHGKLSPGVNQFVSILYLHRYAGRNILPVRLHCHGGNEALINIIGETYPQNIPRHHLPKIVRELPPVPVGSTEGIVVSYVLNNFCDIPLKMKFDVLALNRFQMLHYNHAIAALITRKLILPADGFVDILFQLWPIEERTYEINIPVKFDHESRNYTLTIYVEACKTFRDFGFETEKPKLTLPCQPITLSHDKISFGNVPVCCRLRRIFFMKNTTHFPVKFEWIQPYKLLRQRITFEPKDGYVPARQSIMCHVSFFSGHTPAIYNLHSYIEVITEKGEEERFKSKLRVIPKDRRNLSIVGVKPKLVNMNGVLVEESQPSLLIHFSLLAKTYLLQDFWRMFPENTNKFFIQRPIFRTRKDDLPLSKRRDLSKEVKDEARKIVFELMSMLLYDAMNETDFRSTLDIIAKDSIPYYCQIVHDNFGKNCEKYGNENVTENFQQKDSLSAESAFDLTYWTHSKVFAKQKSLTSAGNQKSGILDSSYIPEDMKIHNEAILVTEKVFEEIIWTLLAEAEKHEFSLTRRPQKI